MSAIVERIGWLLVHSLWQLTLIGLIAGAFARLLRKHSSHSRYGILSAALLLMVASPVLTWWTLPSLSDSRADRPANRSVRDFANAEQDPGNHADPMAAAVIPVPPEHVASNDRASKPDARLLQFLQMLRGQQSSTFPGRWVRRCGRGCRQLCSDGVSECCCFLFAPCGGCSVFDAC